MSALARLVGLKAPPERKAETLPSSHLGPGVTITGILDWEGALHVHGLVRGRINTDKLVVGLDGLVEGDVVAREVLVEGRLFGRIFGHTVTLDASSNVT